MNSDTLLYSARCPYCRFVAAIIDRLPLWRDIDIHPIEADYGYDLVVEHHGEYVHAPHLFESDYVYYGVKPVTLRLLRRTMPDCSDTDDDDRSFLQRMKDCIGTDKSGVDEREE